MSSSIFSENQLPSNGLQAFATWLASALPDPIWIVDREGRIYEVNQALVDMLGVSRAQQIGQLAVSFIESYSQQQFNQLLERAFAHNGEAVVGEISLRTTDATQALLRYTLLAPPGLTPPLVIAIGRPLQEIIQLTRDLASINEHLADSNTRLAQSNAQLARERSRLGLLHRLSQTLSQSLELAQVQQIVLRSTIADFGAQAAGMLLLNEHGAPGDWLSTDDKGPPSQQALARALRDGPQGVALRSREVQRIDDYFQAYPGQPQLLPGRSLLVVALYVQSEALGVLSLAHTEIGFFDEQQAQVLMTVAETSALAIRNAQLYTRLRDVEAARERITNLMVHDIRSPLMATQAGIEITLRSFAGQPLSSFVKDSLESGLRSVRTVVELTNDMLDIKKLQAGSYSLDRQLFSLDQLCQDVSAQMQPLAVQQRLTLTAHVSPPDLMTLADRRLLRRVLVNLVANGLRFTRPAGEVSIHAERNDKGVLLFVDDMGPGVPEDERERIFQPFAQGKNESHRGTGLGLTLCREVVVAHNGSIWVTERPGGGSRFCILIPDPVD